MRNFVFGCISVFFSHKINYHRKLDWVVPEKNEKTEIHPKTKFLPFSMTGTKKLSLKNHYFETGYTKMYYFVWEKRTDSVTNTTPAIRYSKIYYCGWEKKTDSVTNFTPPIRYIKMYYCGWEKRNNSVTNITPAILYT